MCDVWELPDHILSWNGTWRVLSRAPSLSAGGVVSAVAAMRIVLEGT